MSKATLYFIGLLMSVIAFFLNIASILAIQFRPALWLPLIVPAYLLVGLGFVFTFLAKRHP